jgi:hypothetical protein
MQSWSLAAGLESSACAGSGHRPPHGWQSLDFVQSFVQESRQGIRDRLTLLPAWRRAGDVLVALPSEKVIVLLFSMAKLASRLHLNTQATSRVPSLTERLL